MMNGVQEVQHVAKRLGITNVAAVRKAEEYVRLCKVRCPQGLGAVCSSFLSFSSHLYFYSYIYFFHHLILKPI